MALYKNKIPLIFLASTVLFTLQFQDTSGAIGKKGHQNSCRSDSECESWYCEPQSRKCECGMLDRSTKQFYDHELKMCFSRVGHRCTLTSVEDDLPPFNCVPNGECVSSSDHSRSRSTFGTCRCKSGHTQSSDGKQCTSNVELRTAKVSSMDQVRPEGWSRSGGTPLLTTTSHRGHHQLFVAVGALLCVIPFR